jgi:HD-like signal output (HDOD) protein
VKKRILFVDDETAVLDSLRDVLRKERKRWEMSFATGGEAALAELRRQPFDVVVSDMRMPGMDGAALLGQVKEEFPATARLVLSGHAEREAVMRALPVAHQYLSKPCDADTLRVAIERTCDLQRLLADESIRKVVGKVAHLPSVPRTYTALVEAAGDPKTDAGVVAGIVENDPAMSTKILQLVNSAYFGCAQRVASVRQAVNYLGLETLKGLALSAEVFSTLEKTRVPGFVPDLLQRRALLASRLAKKFVADKKRAESAFTAALVAHVGVIVLAMGVPEKLGEAIARAAAAGVGQHEAERELFGVSHAEVGAYLLGVWGLPLSIVEGVAFHHRPGEAPEGDRELIGAVHVACALAEDAEGKGIDVAFLERAGLAAETARWRAVAAEELTRVDAA